MRCNITQGDNIAPDTQLILNGIRRGGEYGDHLRYGDKECRICGQGEKANG